MAIVGRPQEIVKTPRGHRTGSVQFQLKVCGDPLIFLRSPNSSDSGHRRKLVYQKSNDARINCKHLRRSP